MITSIVQEELKDIYEDNVIYSINQPQDQPQDLRIDLGVPCDQCNLMSEKVEFFALLLELSSNQVILGEWSQPFIYKLK